MSDSVTTESWVTEEGVGQVPVETSSVGALLTASRPHRHSFSSDYYYGERKQEYITSQQQRDKIRSGKSGIPCAEREK